MLTPLEFHYHTQKLAQSFYEVEHHGFLVDQARLGKLRSSIFDEIDIACDKVANEIGKPVAACDKPDGGRRNVRDIAESLGIKTKDRASSILNLASPKQLIELFEGRGIKIPTKRGKGGKPGKQSLDEEALLRITLNNAKDPLPNLILKVRELNKIRGTYVETKLLNDTLYCSYRVTGTDTGRRSSQENVFGYGTNSQNLPKHTELGKQFLECLIARPGHIFIEGDQKGAEDWVVQAIIVDNGGPPTGMQELIHGTNRHRKLASYLFGKPESEIDKAGIYYYAGKKTRHAGNYGMQADRMSVVILVETGLNMPPAYTGWLLKKFHEFEPAIQGVFHKCVEAQVNSTRTLTTPLGRERVFFDLRPGSNNADTYRKAYAYIPQSTVGDNTGMAINILADSGYYIVADKHDSIVLEVEDNPAAIVDGINALRHAFDRKIVFPHGTTINIPIEMSVGYNMKDMIECPEPATQTGLLPLLQRLRNTPAPQTTTTTGQPQLQSQPL